MPHLFVEYSGNLDAVLDVDALVTTVHEAALATGLFPVGGTRTRAVRRERYRIADGDPDNGFVHVVARIGHGRTEAQRKSAGEQMFAAVSTHLDPLFATRPLALSLEIQELDPVLNFKRNNLHERLAAKRGSAA